MNRAKVRIRNKIKIMKNFSILKDLGYSYRVDTFETYIKKINNYEIVVTKHTSDKKWECVLIQSDAPLHYTEEVTVNHDCTLDWVIELTKVLSKAPNSGEKAN